MRFTRREALLAAAITTAGASAPGIAAKRSPDAKFLWGAATAAHQVEGGNVNSDYWVMEHVPGTYFREPSGDACASWNRWREDLALVKAGGMNAYRFSVEWARIEPERGEFSTATLARYRRICLAAREMGIEPIVTLHHFTSPRWIAALGGWENSEVADHFARYAERTARALAGAAKWFCTMNEPNAQVTSKIMQRKPWDIEPRLRADAAKAVGSDRFHMYFLGDSFKVRDNCIAAHAKGRGAVKSVIPGARVDMTLALQKLVAGPGGEALYKRIWDNARASFYQAAKGDDFIGVQTYNLSRTGPEGYMPATAALEERDMFGFGSSPSALAATVREAHRETGIPVMVSENGINTSNDAQRSRHLRATVGELARVIDGGVPVIGYVHWSLLDNFEWSSGYVARFGLVAVDPTTFKRTAKPSLAVYREVIAEMRRTNPGHERSAHPIVLARFQIVPVTGRNSSTREVIGASHSFPTQKNAHFIGGLQVGKFIKMPTYRRVLTDEASVMIKEYCSKLYITEGFTAHKEQAKFGVRHYGRKEAA